MSSLPLPPKIIRQDSIVLVRKIDPASGQVVTTYVDKLSGKEVLAPTFHLGGGKLIDPAPS